jgi:hypothetical protein
MILKTNTNDILQSDFYGKWLFVGSLIDFEFDVILTITPDYYTEEDTDAGASFKIDIDHWIINENNDHYFVPHKIRNYFPVSYSIIGKVSESYIGPDIGEIYHKSFYLHENKDILFDTVANFRITDEKDGFDVLSEEQLKVINEQRRESFDLPPIDKNKNVVKR